MNRREANGSNVMIMVILFNVFSINSASTSIFRYKIHSSSLNLLESAVDEKPFFQHLTG